MGEFGICGTIQWQRDDQMGGRRQNQSVVTFLIRQSIRSGRWPAETAGNWYPNGHKLLTNFGESLTLHVRIGVGHRIHRRQLLRFWRGTISPTARRTQSVLNKVIMLYKIHRRPVESFNTTRRPRWFQPDSGEDVPSMAGTRWTRATGTSSTLFRSKYMARWHSVAIKTIRQANQTGGNGPEIEQVPPCGIEACHQMQIWNYYKSTLSLRQRMHTHKRFPTCVGGFIRNLHKKGIQPKNHGSVFLQLGST